jgi:hypothetical protein
LQRSGFGDEASSFLAQIRERAGPGGSVGDELLPTPWSPPAAPDRNAPVGAALQGDRFVAALFLQRENLNYSIDGSTGLRPMTASVLHRRTGLDAA